MKTKAIVAGVVFVASALATWFIIRRNKKQTAEPIERTHHLTEVFSKAKTMRNKKGAAV